MSHRIALLIHALHGGGAEKLMSQLAARWSQQFEVHLITWSRLETDQYPVPESVVRHGLDLMRPSRNRFDGLLSNFRRVRRLRRTLIDIQPEMILSFTDQMNIVALQASSRLGIPTWISEHSDPKKQKLGPLWEKWRAHVYPSCTGCVVLTQEIAAHMSQLIEPSRIRIIPPAIHVSRPDANEALDTTLGRDGMNKDWEPQGNSKEILFVGRLSREKNLDLLIHAWHSIAPDLPDWRLVLVGDGDQRAQLERLAANSSRITFAGWSQNPQTFYERASLFALSSDYEGFPVALLEALKHGVPCIATRCSSALNELNHLGESVRTVPVGDARAYAENLLDLARAPEKREAMSRLAKRVAIEFDWEIIGKKWDEILEETFAA